MPKEVLTLDTLGNVDGGSLRVAANQAIKLATQDLEDRPALKQKRKVVIEMTFEPTIDKQSHTPQLDNAAFSWQIKTNVPAIGKAGTLMSPQSNGMLAFHSDLPDAPDDETLNDEIERNRRGGRDQ